MESLKYHILKTIKCIDVIIKIKEPFNLNSDEKSREKQYLYEDTSETSPAPDSRHNEGKQAENSASVRIWGTSNTNYNAKENSSEVANFR